MKIFEPRPAAEVPVPQPQAPRPIPQTPAVVKLHKQHAVLRQMKPVHREMVKRLVEGQNPKKIAQDLGFSKNYIFFLRRQDPLFRTELERATLNRDIEVHNRMRNLSGEALDVLKALMRDTKSDVVRMEAAKTLLDRAGYGKLEKRVTVTADAESVIRELNRKKANELAEAEESVEESIVVESEDMDEAGAE
jgi:hypothetical protein